MSLHLAESLSAFLIRLTEAYDGRCTNAEVRGILVRCQRFRINLIGFVRGDHPMDAEDEDPLRVRFYGVHDMAAGVHAPRVVELTANFDPEHAPAIVMDVLELHHVQQYLENGLLPKVATQDERDWLMARAPQIGAAVARFFGAVDNSNVAAIVAEVGYEYQGDLLDLLGRSGAFERCDSAIMLPALRDVGVPVGTMLSCRKLVKAYDVELRLELLTTTTAAEYLIRKYLEKDHQGSIYFPSSFKSGDARDLLLRYIDSDCANLNYVRLVSTAGDHADAGIDAKLRLRAKRRSEELSEELFEHGKSFKTGCGVIISDEQTEPVLCEVDNSDGSVRQYTYSRRWLEDGSGNPDILNNFQHLFEFADRQVLLTLPSYPAKLGVIERTIGLTGNAEYKVGAAFRNADMRSLLQTSMYWRFLESQGIDLESVVSWFFETYLSEEFGLRNFSFMPSAGGSSYLQRVRHLFAEMESVAIQFSSFVENGELDRDLLTMGADQVRYKEIPSLLEEKYLYSSDSEEIVGILHLLFSDQSRLKYIHRGLRGGNLVELLMKNSVAFTDFHEYQRGSIDHLINLGILKSTGKRVHFENTDQIFILAALFNCQAANYYHLSKAERLEADRMFKRGWVTRKSSLLTSAEADYFNYFLNRVGFSNGPNLRNKYLHGSQAHADNDDSHVHAYLVALRLIVALVIKINDDLCLWAIDLKN